MSHRRPFRAALSVSRRVSLVGQVGLFALVLNLVLPLMLPTQALALSASLENQLNVLCTPLGLTVLDGDGAQEGGEALPTGHDFCAFCLPLVGGGGALCAGGLVVPAPPLLLTAAVVQPGALAPRSPHPNAGDPARAPPRV